MAAIAWRSQMITAACAAQDPRGHTGRGLRGALNYFPLVVVGTLQIQLLAAR